MTWVREVTADDWELLRDVRLAALAEAPYAFGSTYAREAAFTQAQWRGRVHDRAVTFFAYDDDPAGAGDAGRVEAGTVEAGTGGPGAEIAGLAGVYVEHGTADLVSMWVRPAFRGRGVGEALVEASASWAKAHSFETLSLWVTESNRAALRLYERCGFNPTGERQPLPSDPAFPEIRMSRLL